MKAPANRITGARAPAGWLATTLALAIALVISSWSNYRAARAAVHTLNTGQAEIHASALRAVETRRGPPPDPEVLDSVLVSQAEAGLRYIALIDPDGRVVMDVGEPETPVQPPPMSRTTSRFAGLPLVETDTWVRVYIPRPVPAVVLEGDPQASGGGSRELDRGRSQSTLAFYLLEFEPVPASNIVSQAVRGLVLSGLGATLLTLVALGFWRVSRSYEAAQSEIERQRRLSQLGEMSAVLAHEIRNPLASLKGNAQLLAEESDLGDTDQGSRRRRRADRVVAEARRLEALTSDLLDFARTASPDLTLADPAAIVRAVADDFAPGTVHVDVADVPPAWPLDAPKVRQALINLVRNAQQVSPEGRPPVVRVAVENGELVFTVRDFGPGIDSGTLERIFEPFFTTRTQGTGLGLTVAKRAAELHDGSISAANHPLGGALFTLTLPRHAR